MAFNLVLQIAATGLRFLHRDMQSCIRKMHVWHTNPSGRFLKMGEKVIYGMLIHMRSGFSVHSPFYNHSVHQSAKSGIIPLLVCLWTGRIAPKCSQPYQRGVSGVSYYAGHSPSSCYYHPFLELTCLESVRICWALQCYFTGLYLSPLNRPRSHSLQLLFRPLKCLRLRISIAERFSPLSAWSFNGEGAPLWRAISALGSLVKTQLRSLREVLSRAREGLFFWSRRQISSSRGIRVCKWLVVQLCLCIK